MKKHPMKKIDEREIKEALSEINAINAEATRAAERLGAASVFMLVCFTNGATTSGYNGAQSAEHARMIDALTVALAEWLLEKKGAVVN
jgi:hypothetical protein